MRRVRLFRLLLPLFLILPSLAAAQDEDLTSLFRQAELERLYHTMSTGWEATGKLPEHERLYDVYHYDITVQLDPSDSTLVGTVYVRARSLVDTLSQINLDLIANDTFTVSAISGNGVSFTHEGHLLTIDLDAEYQHGDSFSVCVNYEGGPRPYSTNGLAWRRHGAHPIVQTLVEPAFSHYWWPCKDVPWDKADSSDVTLIVPDTLVGVSNGVLLDIDSVSIPGWKSWHWRTRHPIPPYLIFLAVSNYETIEDTCIDGNGTSIPITHYVWPEDRQAAEITFDYTPEMLEHLDSLYGPYPFGDEGYGHAEVWGVGAMEHNTCTSFGDRLVVTNHGTDNVVVHEIGHQWWGDLVTCENWNDLWLNEGFATYTEALWREHLGGSQILGNHMRGEEYHGGQSVYVDPVPDLNQIFSGGYVKAVYGKASWVLHMLRSIVGTDVFFQILEQHKNDSVARGGFANTAQFQETCESVTGLDLDRFFRQWVFLSGSPQFETLPFVSSSNDTLWLRLTQNVEQDTCFAADLEITFGLTNGMDTTLIAPVGAWCDTFLIVPGGEIANVRFDKNNWLLDDGFNTPLDTALAISEENDEVVLSWTVDHPFVSGVFIYRGATEEGPWEQLTSSSLPLPLNGEFNDGKPAGIRYYTVRAVSDSLPGFFSLPSNIVQTTTPANTELVLGSSTNPGSTNPHFLGGDPYRLRFNLALSGRVQVRLYDITGRLVRTLHDGEMASGFENEIEWDGNNNDGRQVAPGIYLIRFESGNYTDTRKIVVMK